MSISAADFDYVVRLARDQAAIVIEAGKEYLVEARLGDLGRRENIGTYEEVIRRLRAQSVGGELHRKAIDSLTTNETLFFRDFHPYEALRLTVIPDLIRKLSAQRQLTIWSAACSTGQEPYSISMLLLEHFPVLRDWKVNIIATDLSSAVLRSAAEGRYSQLEVNRGLPVHYLIKYFTKSGEHWLVKDEVKKLVSFRQMNLSQAWTIRSPLDLVLIRNVMIYFDVPTKKLILQRIRELLQPFGYLFLGSAETTINLDPGYVPVSTDKTVYYTPLSASAAQAGAAFGAAPAAAIPMAGVAPAVSIAGVRNAA